MDPIIINRKRFVEWIMAQNPTKDYSFKQNEAIDPCGCPMVQYMKNKYPSITDFKCGLMGIISSGGALARLEGFSITSIIPVELRGRFTYRQLQDHLRKAKLA